MNGKPQQETNILSPLITVSIVSHGDSEKILRLLESIRAYEQTKSIQVIVIDNLGHELPELDSSPWSSLVILRNERSQGFARNHNQAFKTATGQYFCLLNPDVVFVEPIFENLLEHIEALQADIIAPLVVDSKNIVQDSFRDLPTPLEIVRRRLFGYIIDPAIIETNEFVHPDWISGIFLLMPSEAYRKLGGLNEKYRLYFEDVEFCTRAMLAGLKLLVDTNVRIQHDAHHASRKKLIYLIWHIQSAVRFFLSPVYRKGLKNSNKFFTS